MCGGAVHCRSGVVVAGNALKLPGKQVRRGSLTKVRVHTSTTSLLAAHWPICTIVSRLGSTPAHGPPCRPLGLASCCISCGGTYSTPIELYGRHFGHVSSVHKGHRFPSKKVAVVVLSCLQHSQFIPTQPTQSSSFSLTLSFILVASEGSTNTRTDSRTGLLSWEPGRQYVNARLLLLNHIPTSSNHRRHQLIDISIEDIRYYHQDTIRHLIEQQQKHTAVAYIQSPPCLPASSSSSPLRSR